MRVVKKWRSALMRSARMSSSATSMVETGGSLGGAISCPGLKVMPYCSCRADRARRRRPNSSMAWNKNSLMDE